MKNKLILVIVAIVVIIVGIIIAFTMKKDYSNDEIVEISYSYGGGFGTEVDTATKTITFMKNGKGKLSNSYNSYTENFNIGKNKYMELSDFISARISLFDEKAKEAQNVLDGSSSYITIKFGDGGDKQIGGYMIENKKFKEIEKKINEVIDKKKLSQYIKNIKTND